MLNEFILFEVGGYLHKCTVSDAQSCVIGAINIICITDHE